MTYLLLVDHSVRLHTEVAISFFCAKLQVHDITNLLAIETNSLLSQTQLLNCRSTHIDDVTLLYAFFKSVEW